MSARILDLGENPRDGTSFATHGGMQNDRVLRSSVAGSEIRGQVATRSRANQGRRPPKRLAPAPVISLAPTRPPRADSTPTEIAPDLEARAPVRLAAVPTVAAHQHV